ncbi:MAG: hypothetical protein ACLFUF_05900, partial [Opitutales bacterium]
VGESGSGLGHAGETRPEAGTGECSVINWWPERLITRKREQASACENTASDLFMGVYRLKAG